MVKKRLPKTKLNDTNAGRFGNPSQTSPTNPYFLDTHGEPAKDPISVQHPLKRKLTFVMKPSISLAPSKNAGYVQEDIGFGNRLVLSILLLVLKLGGNLLSFQEDQKSLANIFS